jgi:hypothetical protein
MRGGPRAGLGSFSTVSAEFVGLVDVRFCKKAPNLRPGQGGLRSARPP